jgi:hypothetical protein
MFIYCNSFEPIMNQVMIIILVGLILLGIIGSLTMSMVLDLKATKSSSKQAKQTSNEPAVQPERGSQQAPEARESSSQQPERQSEFNSQRQENGNGNEDAIQEKDEQFRDVLQDDDNSNDNDNNNNNNDEELDEQIEIDKKAPIAVSGKNVYIVWFNDQNTPNNNSEILFRYSNDRGVTLSDKINLSNTTNADSVDAEIAANGNNVIITWWERNQTSNEPVVRISIDNGTTFGPLLKLADNGSIG